MIAKLTIDLKTLEATSEDSSLLINEIRIEDGKLFLEIVKPDPDISLTPIYVSMEKP